jgi:hypothetical protein
VSRLQSGNAPDCTLFQKIGEQGHYAGRKVPSETRQGTYAAAPSGVLLASLNSNDPNLVAAMLERALAKWEALPREQRLLADTPIGTASVQGWQRLYPADGLVLRVNSRDLPREQADNSGRGQTWNLDFVWFTKAEARQFVPAEIKNGAHTELPQELVERIARLHLVDNVRGETQPFPPTAVEKAVISSKIVEVDADTVKLHLEGATKASMEGIWSIAGYRDMASPSPQKRGYETKILGKAEYDVKKERFKSFEMLAVGMRHGATQYNGRSRDPGPAPMGHAFTLAGDTPAERVPPAFFGAYGWR